jgi:uncharacterized membrane protein SpoIIM required for sporulation
LIFIALYHFLNGKTTVISMPSHYRILAISNAAYLGLILMWMIILRGLGYHGQMPFLEFASTLQILPISDKSHDIFFNILFKNTFIMLAPLLLAWSFKIFSEKGTSKPDYIFFFLFLPLGILLRNSHMVAFGTIEQFQVMSWTQHGLLLLGTVAPHGLIEYGAMAWWMGVLLTFYMKYRKEYKRCNVFALFLEEVKRKNLILKIILVMLLAAYIEAYHTLAIAARLFAAALN